ncbi:MAG: hypothetical protein CM15mP29_2020 [Alphaproteobacteria bacterium]|nr:MAG: hypothetical protein CM15mP29_2020 [Alphaproteobacteria bacterium]
MDNLPVNELNARQGQVLILLLVNQWSMMF